VRTLQTPSSVKKEGEEVIQAPEQRFPVQPVEKTMVRQAVTLQSMEAQVVADLHLQLWRTPHWSRLRPEGGCDPVGTPHWSRFAGRICDPAGYSCWGSLFLKDCTPWERLMLENCLSWVGPDAGAGEECEESFP